MRTRIFLGLILSGFVLLAWAYGLTLPAWENLDEAEHFSAIRYVVETGRLPVHEAAVQAEYYFRQEASQPPLYYLLMGGVVRLLSLPTADANAYLVHNPFLACGPADQPYNRNALYHNPHREAPPWRGAWLTLHVLRAVSPLLQLVTVVGVYAIARLVLPQHSAIALLAAALTAFNPQFLLVASGVNNDNLVTPLATVGVYLTLRARQQGFTWKYCVGLGALAGLAGLSKLSGLLLLPFIGLALLEIAWRSRATSHVSRFVFYGVLTGAAAVAVCGWWFWRNWQLYGDLTALAPMLDWVGRRGGSSLPLNESGLMFRSFWGQLACAFYSDGFYLFFGVLTAAGLVGWVVSELVHKDRKQNRAGMLWLALWFVIIYVGWLRWGALTAATGGRLLFPAIAASSVLLASGLLRLWPERRRLVGAAILSVLLAVVAALTLYREIHPLFAPPRAYAATAAPDIAQRLEATFGPDIRLLGYDAKIESHDLDVTLYWQATTPITQDYALAVQLASPIPGDDTLRFNYNTWPGRGNYPTTAWLPGRVIADRYHFRLPASDAPTQAWQLLVALYNAASGERLPVRLDGQDVGKGLALATLRVPGRAAACPTGAVLSAPVHFGDAIALTAATIQPLKGHNNSQFTISLCWQSLAPTAADYTVFVHLYAENGEMLATGDGPPMDGAFPTHLWQPGDIIADTHGVSGSSGARIGVGLYDLSTIQRLPATQAGQPLPNDTVYLDLRP